MQIDIVHENYTSDIEAGGVLLAAINNLLIDEIYLSGGGYDLNGIIVDAKRLTNITGDSHYGEDGTLDIWAKIYSSKEDALIHFYDDRSLIAHVEVDTKNVKLVGGGLQCK